MQWYPGYIRPEKSLANMILMSPRKRMCILGKRKLVGKRMEIEESSSCARKGRASMSLGPRDLWKGNMGDENRWP